MRLGLQARYALALATLTLSIVLLLGAALLLQFRTTNEEMRRSGYAETQMALMSQLEKYARSMAAHLAENLANPLYKLDVGLIKDLIGSAAAQKGVNYAFVFDASRLVLHDGTETLENYGRLLDDEVTLRAHSSGEIGTAITRDSLEVVAPIKVGSQTLGGVKVSLSLAAVQADINDLQGTLAAISAEGTRNYLVAAGAVCAGLILLSLLLSIRVARGLTQPIKVLTGLTRRIGSGQYEIEIPFARTDEIGELALSLRRMAGELNETTVSKEYVDNILLNMLDPLLVFGEDARIQSANAAACRVLIRDLDDLAGLHVDEILCPDSVSSGTFDFDQIRLRRGPVSVEGSLKRRDGTCIPALISWSAMTVSPGRAQQFLCVARDITERKQAEEALKASEERFRALVANSPSAIFLKDVKGRVVLVNKRVEAWYGISEAEAKGKMSNDLFTEELATLYSTMDREVLQTGQATEFELDVPFADGIPHSVIVTEFPVFGADGQIIGIGTIISDVTEQRKTEEKLRQAQKMEVIGQLTGGVAHDFNNLLAVIIGNAEILQDRLGHDDRSMKAVKRAALRGADLTQRLLAFSRRQPLRSQTILLASLVRDMRDLLTRTLGETIEIVISSRSALWQAEADPGQVESALLNLAINASHAMPDGGKLFIETSNAILDEAYAATQAEVKSGEYVLLSVRDTGWGMAPEVLQHAFEPFFTTKDVGEGSGLGLSMVYGFAKQSGGHVTIYSEESQGTTVKLYLPRAEAGTVQPAAVQAAEVPRGREEVVLVIEDDPDVRDFAVEMLKGLGYIAVEVADASGARDLLSEDRQIDLVLSDVALPGGTSGLEFAEEARAIRHDLKIIFMSGYPAESVKRNGALASDEVLLDKPFERRELAEALRKALD